MYRSSPGACIGCGERLELDKADVSAEGLRCWRCSLRGDVIQLHDAMRTRVPTWQKLVARGSLSLFCLGSIGMSMVVAAAGMPLLALGSIALGATTVYRLLRCDDSSGRTLAFAQGIGLAIAAAGGGGAVFLLAALASLVGMQTAHRAYPLYPGAAPRFLEAAELPLLDAPKN